MANTPGGLAEANGNKFGKMRHHSRLKVIFIINFVNIC